MKATKIEGKTITANNSMFTENNEAKRTFLERITRFTENINFHSRDVRALQRITSPPHFVYSE